MIFRVAKENDVIGGYVIPKGTYVGLGVDVVHNSPKFWKDPHAFDQIDLMRKVNLSSLYLKCSEKPLGLCDFL